MTVAVGQLLSEGVRNGALALALLCRYYYRLDKYSKYSHLCPFTRKNNRCLVTLLHHTEKLTADHKGEMLSTHSLLHAFRCGNHRVQISRQVRARLHRDGSLRIATYRSTKDAEVVEMSGPLAAYSQLIQEGRVRRDEHQLVALNMLQQVCCFISCLCVLVEHVIFFHGPVTVQVVLVKGQSRRVSVS